MLFHPFSLVRALPPCVGRVADEVGRVAAETVFVQLDRSSISARRFHCRSVREIKSREFLRVGPVRQDWKCFFSPDSSVFVFLWFCLCVCLVRARVSVSAFTPLEWVCLCAICCFYFYSDISEGFTVVGNQVRQTQHQRENDLFPDILVRVVICPGPPYASIHDRRQ